MHGGIGDINKGIVGISHTTGTQDVAMPVKRMEKPASGSTITVHTSSALNLEDSESKLLEFVRGTQLESYSPAEQQEYRTQVMEHMQSLEETLKETDKESAAALHSAVALLKEDETLAQMAMMARNVLISA